MTSSGDLFDRYIKFDELGEGNKSKTFKVVDIKNNEIVAMKVTASVVLEIIYTVDDEPAYLSELHEKFDEYTSCIIDFKDSGELSPDIIFLWDLEVTDSGDRYEVNEDEETPVVIFITMPIVDFDFYKDDENFTAECYKDFMFETMLTLMILNEKRVYHGDIHKGNIGVIKVDYVRQYKVNDVTYTVTSKYLPIIIDWVRGMSYNPFGGKQLSDLYYFYQKVSKIMGFTLPDVFDEILSSSFRKNIETIEHQFFQDLRQRDIMLGDKVKYFTPVTLTR